mgnify:CR=1 FL=1
MASSSAAATLKVLRRGQVRPAPLNRFKCCKTLKELLKINLAGRHLNLLEMRSLVTVFLKAPKLSASKSLGALRADRAVAKVRVVAMLINGSQQLSAREKQQTASMMSDIARSQADTATKTELQTAIRGNTALLAPARARRKPQVRSTEHIERNCEALRALMVKHAERHRRAHSSKQSSGSRRVTRHRRHAASQIAGPRSIVASDANKGHLMTHLPPKPTAAGSVDLDEDLFDGSTACGPSNTTSASTTACWVIKQAPPVSAWEAVDDAANSAGPNYTSPAEADRSRMVPAQAAGVQVIHCTRFKPEPDAMATEDVLTSVTKQPPAQVLVLQSLRDTTSAMVEETKAPFSIFRFTKDSSSKQALAKRYQIKVKAHIATLQQMTSCDNTFEDAKAIKQALEKLQQIQQAYNQAQ